MISSEDEYKRTRDLLKSYEALIAKQREILNPVLDSAQLQRALDPLLSFLEGLKEEMCAYVKQRQVWESPKEIALRIIRDCTGDVLELDKYKAQIAAAIEHERQEVVNHVAAAWLKAARACDFAQSLATLKIGCMAERACVLGESVQTMAAACKVACEPANVAYFRNDEGMCQCQDLRPVGHLTDKHF